MTTPFIILREFFLPVLKQNIKVDEELICVFGDIIHLFDKIIILIIFKDFMIAEIKDIFYFELITSQFHLLWVNSPNGFNAMALAEFIN